MTIKLLDNLDVYRRFPTQVLEILDRLRKSKSKERDCDPKELKFSLEWSEYIDEKVRSNRINRIYVCLSAKINKWRGCATTPIWVGPKYLNKKQTIGECPIEVIDVIKSFEKSERKEKRRISKLSPEELDNEIIQIVKELKKEPGFFVL